MLLVTLTAASRVLRYLCEGVCSFASWPLTDSLRTNACCSVSGLSMKKLWLSWFQKSLTRCVAPLD